MGVCVMGNDHKKELNIKLMGTALGVLICLVLALWFLALPVEFKGSIAASGSWCINTTSIKQNPYFSDINITKETALCVNEVHGEGYARVPLIMVAWLR